jgi:hypothetical protein
MRRTLFAIVVVLGVLVVVAPALSAAPKVVVLEHFPDYFG